MTSVSHSRLESYLLCKRKVFYAYERSLQRGVEGFSLAYGSMGHEVLATFYNAVLRIGGDSAQGQRDAYEEALQEAREFYNSKRRWNHWDNDRMIPLEQELFDWYFQHEPITMRGWQVLAVEHPFNLALTDELSFNGYIDLIAYDPDGLMVVIDHKFLGTFYGGVAVSLQPQIPRYLMVLRAMGLPAAYGAYNMLRNAKLKVSTKNTPSDRMQFMPIKPTDKRVGNALDEILLLGQEIIDRESWEPDEQDATAYRVANKLVCNSCSFQTICEAELSGKDTRLMLRTEYKTKDKREQIPLTDLEED